MGSDQTNMNEDEKFNPWDVNELEEFLFFCCPECDDRSPTKASFINHALIQHPRVRKLNIYKILKARSDSAQN